MSALDLAQAKDAVRRVLVSLLGPTMPGVNAFGVSYDRNSGQRVVRVGVDPAVSARVRGEVPGSIGPVEVQVRDTPPAEFE
jgi:hypothetical protein